MSNTAKNAAGGKILVFKQEWFDALREMSAKVRLQVYEAVMMYQATGEVPQEMSKVARMAFHFIRKEIDVMNGSSAAESDEDQILRTLFYQFALAYPGKKVALADEYDNLRDKNPKDWREIVPRLMPALLKMYKWRKDGSMVPENIFPELTAWINRQCWKEDYPRDSTGSSRNFPTAINTKVDASTAIGAVIDFSQPLQMTS